MPPAASASTTQCILHWARATPYTAAVIEQDTSYSYGDLAIGVTQYATALQASGVRPGMLVGLECRRRYLHFLVILACELVGATSVSLSPAELAAGDAILGRCGFLCVTTLPPDSAPRAGLLHLTQETIDRIARLPITARSLDQLDRRPDDAQVLRLARTSGSTGRPKVMAITHAATERLMQRTAATDGTPDYEWNFINLYNFALRSAQLESQVALRRGKSVVSSHLETAYADLQRFDECRLTLLAGDAARLVALCPTDWPGRRRCLLMIKAGPISSSIRQRLLRDVGTDLAHSYAANETYRLSFVDEAGVGTLCEGVSVRVVDDAGRILGTGETGLIEGCSTSMVEGYLWDAEATRAAFVDGWYRTNDVGFMPAPDKLVVLGRADDMLNIGGVKISPCGLEDRIRALNSVADTVLLALPDHNGTAQLTVTIELRDADAGALLQEHVGEIVRPYVDEFAIRIVDSLPRTDTGKVIRAEVRRMLAQA